MTLQEARKKVKKYIDSVLSGKRCAGELEVLSVKRHIDDLEKDWEYYFDEKAAYRSIAFFYLLKHFKGEWAGREFELEGWQCFILWCVFGWKKKSDGCRRFNYADIEVARKNGKTTLAAGIGLYMLLLDSEAGAEIYSAAVDREQAKICWDAAVEIAKMSPDLRDELLFFKKSILLEVSASFFKPLSKDSGNKDGLNPHCAICDERHAWPTNEVFDVLKSAIGARKQPLILSITTAGFDTSSPYFKDLGVMTDILRGVKQQENHFIIIFQPDKEDDWKDVKTWGKANPNLEVSVSLEYMQNELNDAINKGGRTEVNFKTKNLNMWVDAPEVWISDDRIALCNRDVPDSDLRGLECYGGLDFASHVDINALALYFPSIKVVKLFCWVPEQKIIDDNDRADYRVWAEDGWLIKMPGEVLDTEQVTSDILRIVKDYNLKNLAFDPYKAYHGIIQGLDKGGLSDILDEYSQGIKNMSEPTKELERMILAEEISFLNNPVIRWMFGNVATYYDPNNNIKLLKNKSRNKIDGVIALINAIGGYMSVSASDNKGKIYQNHTLRTVKL